MRRRNGPAAAARQNGRRGAGRKAGRGAEQGAGRIGRRGAERGEGRSGRRVDGRGGTARGLGLRGKLALTVAAVTALVAALIGVLVHAQTSRTQLESARRDIDARLLEAVTDYQRLVDGGVRVDPPELPAPLREAVTREPVRATYLERTEGDPVLWAALVERTPEGEERVLAVRQSYRSQAEALAALDRTLLGAGLLAALLGSLLGLVPAAVAGRRISSAARTAQRIAEGDLAARVRPRGRDEIARLSAAVNTMAEALGARLEAERRITADIAHELRTPVAGLVTAAELLPPGRPTELVRDRAGTLRRLVEDVLEVARLDTEGAERAEFESCRMSMLVRQAVAACTEQLPADLPPPAPPSTPALPNAPAPSAPPAPSNVPAPSAPSTPAGTPGVPASPAPADGDPAGSVPAGSVPPGSVPVDDGPSGAGPAGSAPSGPAGHRLPGARAPEGGPGPAGAGSGRGRSPIQVVVTSDAEVWTDPRRVARILGNLLSNAVRHGAPPVRVEVAGPVLRLRDHGPGFPAEMLAHGPQRFRTGARERGTGTGLGLTIVTGQARLLGARVSWSNAPDGGAVTTVELPTAAPAGTDHPDHPTPPDGQDGQDGQPTTPAGPPDRPRPPSPARP